MFKRKQFHSILEVRIEIDKAIEFYNTQRPHMSIDLMTPVQVLERT
ncbi:integrase core domain-containing protein [Hoylesella pleuritidis]